MADRQRQVTVMIAVDRSQNAEDAFSYYVEYLHKDGDKVILVHVPEGPTVTESHGIHISDGEIRKMREKERKETDEMIGKYKKIIQEKSIPNCEYKTRYGKAGEALVEAAQEVKASYVVVGTRGMGTIRRTIMGSISDYLLHHLHVPLIIVRQ